MVNLGRTHIVKEMHKMKPKTDLIPQPFEVSAQNNDYSMCTTLINLDDDNIYNSLRNIENNQCKFEEYIKMGNPEVTASLFSKKDWLICESYQYLILTQIMDSIKDRDQGNNFYLIKALCGPNIPYHLIRGIGMQRLKDDRTKYPSIVEQRRKYIDEYRQHKNVFNKFRSAFAPYIYIITKAPVFDKDEDGKTECKNPFKPFENQAQLDKELEQRGIQKESLIYQALEKLEKKEQDKITDDNKDKLLKNYVDVNLKQKFKLTSSEAYSFSVLRQKLINEPMDVDSRKNEKTNHDLKIGQRLNPIDISDLQLDPIYIKIVAQLIDFEEHKNVPSLTKKDIEECDKVVELLMLDRQRAVYFSRSRAFNQKKAKYDINVEKKLHDDKKFYFDENWKTVANLDQFKYNQLVLHPYLAKYKSHVADLRWVQVLYNYTLPPEAIAIKSFKLQIESYRSIISLNIVKPQYQTSYIISNETDTAANAKEIYFEKYVEKDVIQEQLPFPDGFKDVISSVESGDTIKILMSRTQKCIELEKSSYVNNLQINIQLVERQSDQIPDLTKKKYTSDCKEKSSGADLKTNELVIKADTDILKLRVKSEHKKLFPLLDYVENSRISNSDDLNYFESFFSVGNMSELSKSMTAKMWNQYKDKECEGGFSFKSCIYPGIKIRNSTYGVCAYSSDSYNAFSELFETMILKIHKKNDHQSKASIITGETSESVLKHNLEYYFVQKREKQQQTYWKENDYNRMQKELISTIKINIRRNLAKYPLCPGLTKSQRNDVMMDIKKVCENLAEDLKESDFKQSDKLQGKFLEMKDVTDADKKKLGDHIFSISDEFQIKCDLAKHWPEGRAIFYNDDLSFVIKINGEDHMDIEYSQSGTCVDDFFVRKFNKISQKLEEKLTFSTNPKLGYVTTLPENLGSSFKIQTIVLAKNLKSKTETGKKLDDIQAQQSNIQEFIKENESHVVNIKDDGSAIGKTLNPKQISIFSEEKIGTSNRQAVHKMNLSINRLIDKENMFKNKELINKKTELKNYEHLFIKQQGEYGVNRLQSYLTKNLWEKYRDQKTDDGINFIECVYPGIKEINSDIILCAGSEQCYEKFGDLFNQYIRDQHGHDSSKKKIASDMTSENMLNTNFELRNTERIQGVRMSIKRNFDGIPFGPSGPSSKIREDILQKFDIIAENFKEMRVKEFEGQFYKLGKINIGDKKILGNIPMSINDNTTINDENLLRAAQLDKDWPNGRALYVNGDKSFVMKLNFIDHLEITIDQTLIVYVDEVEVLKPPEDDPNGKKVKTLERRYSFDYCNIFKAFQNLCQASKVIEETCKFSKSESLGFLTSLPRDLGFFEIRVDLFMPIMYKMLQNIKNMEDFAHYDILRKYDVEIELEMVWGKMNIKPYVVNQMNVYRAHNQKMDYMDEAYDCPRRPGLRQRHLDTQSQSTLRTKYYDIKQDKSFNRFNKNEKMMVQDILSCVKELTDQENRYTTMQNMFLNYYKLYKHADLIDVDYDSFFIERDKRASMAYGTTSADACRPPFHDYNSILKQVMTREKFEKFKEQKCDKGVPFTLCIYPDIKNRGNSYGLLAGSTSFYQKFSEVYYDYIKEFHDFEPKTSNVLKSQFTKESIDECKNLEPIAVQEGPGKMLELESLNVDKSFILSSQSMIKNCKFSDTNQRMIKQVIFSVRRNLENYPFGVQMKLNERVELMLEVQKATSKFKSDLAGDFYRLKHMRHKDEYDLKEFIFRKQEKWQSSGFGGNTGYYSTEAYDSNYIGGTELFSDWPYGRAVYVNKDKSFAIKVGNVDHLEIMSFQDNSTYNGIPNYHEKCDIETNFKNLMRGVGHLDNHLQFAYDENIGYTTSIIKNLGVIDLYIKFAPKYYKFYRNRLTPATVAKKFNVELDVSEQMSDSDSIVLRNKIKFGMTESQIVQDMVNCLQAFFTFEDEYSLRFDVEFKIPSYISMIKDTKEEDKSRVMSQWVNFEMQLQTFHDSLIEDKMYKNNFYKILTKQIWEDYLGKKCTYGFSFNDTIVDIIQNFAERRALDKQLIAGSQDAYRTFGKYFLNILKELEDERADAFAESLENSKMPNKISSPDKFRAAIRDLKEKQRQYTNNQYDKEDNDFVKKVVLSVRRNIDGYPLAAAMTKKQRTEVRDKVINACREFQGALKTQVYRRDGEWYKQKKSSHIEDTLNQIDVRAHEESQLIKKYQEVGSAVIYNQDGSFQILVNDIDHLEVRLRREKCNIPEAVENFSKILKTLDNQLQFAFDEVLGYITAKPNDLGYISIEIQVELKDLQTNGQDLKDHVKGDFIMKAGRKFSKDENENNSSENAIYELTNQNQERGKDEQYQIQNMFNYMHEVYKANRKYIQFNKIKKVTDIEKKTFEEIFPPRRGDQPIIFKENMITEELWDQTYNKGLLKCDMGKTFAACMFPGFIYKEDKLAICAQSASSYEKFSEVFDKFIIKGPKQKEFVCGGYQNIEIYPSQLKNVRKMQITVLRNIVDYPLVPGMKKKQRIQLMEKIEKCCMEFEDDLQGIFYKLEDISESDKKVITNISIKKPDDESFYGLAGQGKDWPSGRAVFTNTDQTFYIKVNHSDHMEITYIKQDNVSIQDFLQRFMEILQKIELQCQFQFTQKNGYLTTYPYQLRYVDMRVWIDDQQEIKADTESTIKMATDLECRIKRDGENNWLMMGNLNSDVNKPGISEQNQIQNLIELVQIILKKIKQNEDLKKGYDMQLDNANNLKTYDVFMSKPEMKMALYLEKEMWEEYNLMTCELGIQFKKIVFPGIKDLDDEKYTLCASSLSCYKLYHKLFESYLKQNHPNYSSNANHPEMVSVSFINHNFKPADRNLVQQVQFKVRRNFAGIPIGPGLTKDKRKLVLQIVEDLSRSYHGTDEGKFYKLENLSDDDKKELEGIEISKLEESFLNNCKINDDWPKDRGVFLSKDKSLIIKVNFLDHLEITYNVHERGFMESLDKFQDCLSHLETKGIVAKKDGPFMIVGIHGSNPVTENQITSTCRFAHDQKLGYITALPKLINEFKLKIWLKVHIDMEPLAASANQNSTETNVGGGHDMYAGSSTGKSYGSSEKLWGEIYRESKFKWIEKKEGGDQENKYPKKYQYNVIANEGEYAISEQTQLQNAINCLQAIFDKYAPKRKYNPYLGDEIEEQ